VDSLEQALLAALPLGPQADAGGVSLPELFRVSRAAAAAAIEALKDGLFPSSGALCTLFLIALLMEVVVVVVLLLLPLPDFVSGCVTARRILSSPNLAAWCLLTFNDGSLYIDSAAFRIVPLHT